LANAINATVGLFARKDIAASVVNITKTHTRGIYRDGVGTLDDVVGIFIEE
jgi:hypothetical protein